MKPIIGITCNLRKRNSELVHELQDRYVQAVVQAGGVPVLLPRVLQEDVAALVQQLDGVIISGGRDIPPKFYGAEPHEKTNTDEEMEARVAFEIALVKAMAEANKPVLGICHGCQLLSVAFGGTLVQDIPSQWANPCQHRLENEPWFVEHEVELTTGTLLWDWLRVSRIIVKSAHHQAVNPSKAGDGLRIVAWAPDGIVEAIEATNGRCIIGVQWHPEAQLDAEHAQRLFAAFVNACCAAR